MDTRAAILLSALTLASLTVGCGSSSGELKAAAFSDDRDVLMFSDKHGHGIFVADARLPRKVASDDGPWTDFWLSRDGRFVLVLHQSREGTQVGFQYAGDHVVLYDVERDKRYETTLPAFPEAVKRMSPAPEGKRQPICTRLSLGYREPPRVGFATGPMVALRLRTDDNSFAVGSALAATWSPQQGWRLIESWAKADKELAMVAPARTRDTENWWSPFHENPIDPEPFPGWPLVMFEPNGWNARRTVWVRPDGSVMEVARHNDSAGMLLLAWPFLLLGPFTMGATGYGAELDSLKAQDQGPAQAVLDRLVRSATTQSGTVAPAPMPFRPVPPGQEQPARSR